MKKYIILTETFPPCPGGGIAEWAMGVAESLSRNGKIVDVYARWRRKPDLSMHHGQNYHIYRMGGIEWRKFREFYSLIFSFIALVKNRNAYLIATTWEMAVPIVFLKKIFPSVKWIVIAHGLEVTKVHKKNRQQLFIKVILLSDLVIAVSNFTRNSILDLIGNENRQKVTYIPNGINPDRFNRIHDLNYLRERHQIAEGTKILITLSRIIERKGHDTVIRALPRILERAPETVYLIGGPVWDQNFHQYLLQLIRELKLEGKVIFTGFIDPKDLNAYYSLADVYIMVSRILPANQDAEGFGITFLEANACQTPVIGSYSGGIPDAIEDGVSGYLVQPDKPEELAEKILKILENPGLGPRMGEMGLQRIRDGFTWEVLSKRIADRIEEII